MDDQNKHAREDICPSKRDSLVQLGANPQQKPASAPEFWRSLEELDDDAGFREMLQREFPREASVWPEGASRRGFLKLMGASLAMAGMTACTKQPLEPIVPYVTQPENVIPGRPLWFATAFEMSGYATPLVVESHLYRPTKVEGNAHHPATLGGTDIFSQASILGLYDPDRSQTITYLGDVRTWGEFLSAIQGPMNAQKAVGGAGIRVLTQTVSSPTLAAQMQDLLKKYPQAKWHVYEPVNRDMVRAGSQLAFGEQVDTQYHFSAADVIVSLDADFLYAGFPGNVGYARDYASRRNPDGARMNRMYVIESTPSSTGAKADHHLPVRAIEIEMFARALASALGVGSGGSTPSSEQARYVQAIARDLQAHRGASVIVAGEHQTPAVHALCHAMNAALGNVGKTVTYTETVDANPIIQSDSLKELVDDIRAGKVDALFVVGGNPAYDAPADFGFADVLKNGKVPLRVHLGLYNDETAELCQWHINEAHYLESWGDARACDGTVTIVQPLIAPMYAGRTRNEMIATVAGYPEPNTRELVQTYWKAKAPGDFDLLWRRWLNNGFIENTALPQKQVTAKGGVPAATPVNLSQVEINFRRDPSIYDGRFCNNAWLQELPKPMTKLTWDNAVMIGPAMAERLGAATKDVLRIELNGQKIEGAAWIQAGHPDNSVTVFLGYGRTRAGAVGTGAGFNYYPMRYSAAPWFTTGVNVQCSGGTYELSSTQGYQTMDAPDKERPLVRTLPLEEYKKDPEFAREDAPAKDETLYPRYPYDKEQYAWGMAIDLNSCVGCNNCMIACQSENNVPVVGKEQVNRGRHMHWLRVDTYYQGDRERPAAYFQPVPCMQCENAPCEVVCPVGATVHSTEGLNDMVYNRCVGTRYCSDNCPYKVRRFNFFLFQDWTTPQFKMMRNPDVTVRSRGVMEKCTYCVQRITEHRIDAEREDKVIADGELQTACQQSCPANAIVFGNINDPESRVSKLKALSRNYGLLQDLNTRPRTTYLAEIRNPNPELAG